MFQAVCKWDITARHLIFRLFHREEGQDLVEYALLLAAISVAALAIILLMGPYVKNSFQFIVNQLGKA